MTEKFIQDAKSAYSYPLLLNSYGIRRSRRRPTR